MVGAIILFAIALVTGVVGLTMWIFGEMEAQLMRGILLCLISAISLTGALIIDGIRYYATRATGQLEWIARRTGYFGGSIERQNEEGGAGPLGSQRMSRFHIIGKDQDTGLDTELVVQAVDQTAALRTGEKAGIDVRRVERLD